MEGSVRKRPSGKWSYRFSYIDQEGKRKQIERGGFSTEKTAQMALSEAIYEYEQRGSFCENRRISFHDCFLEYINCVPARPKAYGTVNLFKSIYNTQIKEELGHYFLYQISPPMVYKFLEDRASKYSLTYVSRIYSVIRGVFAFAIKQQYLKEDPTKEISIPSKPVKDAEIAVYNKEELKKMRDVIKSSKLSLAFAISTYTGLRKGECFALRWRDIDLNKRILYVTKQLQYQDEQWCLVPLKTESSYRAIPIPGVLCQELKRNLEMQERARKKKGPDYKENLVFDKTDEENPKLIEVDDFVNVKADGTMLNNNSVMVLSRMIKRNLGIPFHFHALRHTYATTLIENGVSPKQVQALLGHSDIKITLKYYVHVSEEMTKGVKSTINSVIDMPMMNKN